MTKEQFYRNCLTSEGQEINKNTFRPLTMETYYKNTQIDINDMRNWNEIVYLSKYGNQITWEAFIDGEEVEKPIKNDKGEIIGTIKEIQPDETFGQLLDQDKWEIYTMWDIIQKTIWVCENVPPINKKSLQEYSDIAKQVFDMAKGESIAHYIGELTNKIL